MPTVDQVHNSLWRRSYALFSWPRGSVLKEDKGAKACETFHTKLVLISLSCLQRPGLL